MSRNARLVVAKADKARSSFLQLVMPELSGDAGKQMTAALLAGKYDEFLTLWTAAGRDVVARHSSRKE